MYAKNTNKRLAKTEHKAWHELYLVVKNGRVVSKPRVLPLSLAVSKTRVYEQPVLTRLRELPDHIQHLIPESCFRPKKKKDRKKEKKISFYSETRFCCSLATTIL